MEINLILLYLDLDREQLSPEIQCLLRIHQLEMSGPAPSQQRMVSPRQLRAIGNDLASAASWLNCPTSQSVGYSGYETQEEATMMRLVEWVSSAGDVDGDGLDDIRRGSWTGFTFP